MAREIFVNGAPLDQYVSKTPVNVPGDLVYDMQPRGIQTMVTEIREATNHPRRLQGISRFYRRGEL